MGNVLAVALLLSACGSPESPPPFTIPDDVNFNRDIAPIVHANCTPCHRKDGGAPFEMIDYRDVAKRAKMVRQVTTDRFMPPWPADPTYSSFVGERFLTEKQIALIAAWAEAGAPRGEGDAPTPPDYPTGSMLGTPDLTFPFLDSILIPGDNLDRFMVIKIPFEL